MTDLMDHLKLSGKMVVPPNYTPTISTGVRPEHVQTIENIRYCLVYVWTKNRQEFWFVPTECKNGVIQGYAWYKRIWIIIKLRTDKIKSYY